MSNQLNKKSVAHNYLFLGIMLGSMILGAVVVVMCLSISHLFSMYDLHHMLDQKDPDKEWKDWK